MKKPINGWIKKDMLTPITGCSLHFKSLLKKLDIVRCPAFFTFPLFFNFAKFGLYITITRTIYGIYKQIITTYYRNSSNADITRIALTLINSATWQWYITLAKADHLLGDTKGRFPYLSIEGSAAA
jgi:hypothetical protein